MLIILLYIEMVLSNIFWDQLKFDASIVIEENSIEPILYGCRNSLNLNEFITVEKCSGSELVAFNY